MRIRPPQFLGWLQIGVPDLDLKRNVKCRMQGAKFHTPTPQVLAGNTLTTRQSIFGRRSMAIDIHYPRRLPGKYRNVSEKRRLGGLASRRFLAHGLSHSLQMCPQALPSARPAIPLL